MTRSSLNQPFLREAERIGTGILGALQAGQHHLLIDRPDQSFLAGRGSDTVFSGGISSMLVLLELSRLTGNNGYLSIPGDLILRAAARIHDIESGNFSFYNGCMSVGYALARLSVLTGERKHLDAALDIAKKCSEGFLHHPYASDALFNGRAGVMLALLDLYSMTRERWLLEKLHLFASKIMKNAVQAEQGIYWSETHRKASEIGLGYGVSGIGLAMLEVGHFFDNEAYCAVAEAAFSYEDQFWNDPRGNWTASSGEIETPHDWQLHYRKFTTGELGFFEEPSDDISYVQGCIGIGLVRLRAWQLLQRPAYRDMVVKTCQMLTVALQEKKASWKPEEKINAGTFLLQVYNVTGLEQYLEQPLAIAEEVQHSALKMLDTEKRNDAALPLELPTAMTHLLLQLHRNSSSPFFPVITKAEPARPADPSPFLNWAVSDVRRLLVEKDFYRTVYFLEYFDAKALNEHFRTIRDAGRYRESFIRFVQERVPQSRPRYEQALTEIFELEMTKVKIAEDNRNAALSYMRTQLEMEQAAALLQLEKERFLSTRVALNERVRLVRTSIHPDLDTRRIPEEYDFDGNRMVITVLKPVAQKACGREIRETYNHGVLRFSHDRVRETHLNPVEEWLIENLAGTPPIGDWLDQTINGRGYSSGWQMLVVETMKSLLTAGIVTPVLHTDNP
jgi:rhamnogalacturonyl hydrolase YesR